MANPISEIPPANAHCMKYRVCYGDTDRMDRVYYGNYLTFCERARTELLRDAGVPYKEMETRGYFLPVRSCNVRYLGFAEYDDELSFYTWATKVRHATAKFTTAICRDEGKSVLVVAEVELACISNEGKPVPFPDDIIEAIKTYQV
ncbi:MAG: acyl-CoA thioesterase [Planctomycetes bacterium]|nr:acyl-CoA thioesterase [Planctomycetota bacterium]